MVPVQMGIETTKQICCPFFSCSWNVFDMQQVLASYEPHLSVLTGALAVWVQDMG